MILVILIKMAAGTCLKLSAICILELILKLILELILELMKLKYMHQKAVQIPHRLVHKFQTLLSR